MKNESVSDTADFTGIDLLKYIMAFSVIAIHVSAKSCTGEPLSPFGQWYVSLAVPFFFIVSGFLLGRKIDNMADPNESRNLLKKRSFQLFRIFGYWLIIYLPITIYLNVENHQPFLKAIIGYLSNVLLRGQSNYAWPLWFIYSMAIVLLLFSIMGLNRKCRLFFTALFVSVVVIDWYGTIYPSKYLRIATLLTFRELGGGIYIIAGIYLYDLYYKIFRNLNFIRCLFPILFFIISVILYCYELPFWQLMGGIGAFLFALGLTFNPNPIFLWLRKQSMWIYYLHMYPVFLMVLLGTNLDIDLKFWHTYLYVCLLTLLLTNIIGYLSQNKWTFLNNLIR